MRIIGRPRALLAVLAACLLVAGCGSGPSQVGAAVIVGGRVVSVDDVQKMVEKVTKAEPAAQQLARNHKLDLVSRAIIGQLVVHDLLGEAAKKEGLRADQAQVDQLFAQNPLGVALPTDGSAGPDVLAQQLAFRSREQGEVYTDQVLLKQLGEKYLDKLSITFDYTSVGSDDPSGQPGSLREKALEKARQFAQGPAEVARVIAEDKGTGAGAGEGERVPASQAPDLAGSALFGVPPGTVVALQLNEQQANWVVAVIRERTQDATPGVDQAAPVDEGQYAAAGRRLLQPYFDQAAVKINPRFGVWDPVALGLAPNENETKGIVLPAKESLRP
ncbi:SurA N-terminal domain-containing protein [Amycolatopsis nigrescens]|uniref:SurA N-terminal domain-containing protein n=1 Tax=Amycolatopsis nigrescens TaxID=381445 RepID=UPI0004769D34|nr:SurA N-terminal domain-containing protein [Amycolatopsis nigrescens]